MYWLQHSCRWSESAYSGRRIKTVIGDNASCTYVEISVSVVMIDSYVEVTPSRCEYRVAPQLNNLAGIIFENIITVWTLFPPVIISVILCVYTDNLCTQRNNTKSYSAKPCSRSKSCIDKIVNPLFESSFLTLPRRGYRFCVWEVGGGLLKPPPPKKSMRELAETPCCYRHIAKV